MFIVPLTISKYLLINLKIDKNKNKKGIEDKEEKKEEKGMFKAYQVAQEMIRDRLEDKDKEAAKD